jgi:hypothetical protein
VELHRRTSPREILRKPRVKIANPRHKEHEVVACRKRRTPWTSRRPEGILAEASPVWESLAWSRIRFRPFLCLNAGRRRESRQSPGNSRFYRACDILIKGGTVVDPGQHIHELLDVVGAGTPPRRGAWIAADGWLNGLKWLGRTPPVAMVETCPSPKCCDERDSLPGWLPGTDSLIASPGSSFRL